ncbi:unnamed protein product [Spirodela intermedia]|uniref:Uncharacterized protein n=1 Tax=Spirodela intermedia TaxID=51605 RepID=A0A7I8IJ36_SPIIN|nr:unnamed protein product [Spirodela intermedia]CAA6657749.1 unnamed protein product [Spirodela intermedia]
MSGEGSPCNNTSWNQSAPYVRSPWSRSKPSTSFFTDDGATFPPGTRLVGSLVREEGHIYSLASSADLLYTGSDSKNIRVWKNQEEFSGFKSNSGLVKAIVIAGERIFTGHQDGKIRVWRVSRRDPTVHKRAGTLPTFKDLLKSSVRPSNYVEVRRHRNSLWIRHSDAVSTFKVWRVADSRCLESVRAHDDAVNAILTGFDGLVFTGSADGTVKHSPSQTLLKQESAVTALALNSMAAVVYSGSSDGLINFWERKKHLSHGGVLRGHKQAVLCMASAGSLVMSGSADRTICIWRWEDEVHTCLSVLNGHTGPVKCLTVERDSDSHPPTPAGSCTAAAWTSPSSCGRSPSCPPAITSPAGNWRSPPWPGSMPSAAPLATVSAEREHLSASPPLSEMILCGYQLVSPIIICRKKGDDRPLICNEKLIFLHTDEFKFI